MDLYSIIQQQFDSECDEIQIQTEKLLKMVPKNDQGRRKKILDLHKMKLKEAIVKLNSNLKSL